jgi:hypothetical protein
LGTDPPLHKSRLTYPLGSSLVRCTSARDIVHVCQMSFIHNTSHITHARAHKSYQDMPHWMCISPAMLCPAGAICLLYIPICILPLLLRLSREHSNFFLDMLCPLLAVPSLRPHDCHLPSYVVIRLWELRARGPRLPRARHVARNYLFGRPGPALPGIFRPRARCKAGRGPGKF